MDIGWAVVIVGGIGAILSALAYVLKRVTDLLSGEVKALREQVTVLNATTLPDYTQEMRIVSAKLTEQTTLLQEHIQQNKEEFNQLQRDILSHISNDAIHVSSDTRKVISELKGGE